MKPLPTFLTIVVTSILVLVLISSGFPNNLAFAAGTAPITPSQSTPSTGTDCDASGSVHVSGTAVINITPDRALIQLGVQSNGVTPGDVEISNSAATQAVIRAVRSLGVDAKDIATDWYVVEPVYTDYDALNIKGYRINNMIAITLRDVSKTSQVIVNALEAGANQVINVDFYTSELRKYRDQARDMAMAAAREKAQALTVSAGAVLGCVVSINENSWSYYNGGWYGSSRTLNQWTQNVVQNVAPSGNESGATGDEPISLGQISVKAEIDASFGLK